MAVNDIFPRAPVLGIILPDDGPIDYEWLCLDGWLPVFAVPGTRFVNLQYGERAPVLKALADRHADTVADWPEAVDDLDDSAAENLPVRSARG